MTSLYKCMNMNNRAMKSRFESCNKTAIYFETCYDRNDLDSITRIFRVPIQLITTI